MSSLSSNIAQALANLGPAEQARAQERLKKAPVKPSDRRPAAHRDEVVLASESTDPIRSLRDYSEEEAREDRRGSYLPDGARAADDEHSLDVNG